MKTKNFLFGMLSLMMAAVLCGVMSSCNSDDPFTHRDDDPLGGGNGDVVPWDGSITETYFPDETFRKYLLKQDYGRDGVITKEEILNITEIDVYGKDILSLKGIEYFTALTWLDCSSNQLTSLDVSKNIALTYLICGGNRLKSLDVSKNTALTELYCQNNQLTSLDVSGCTAMTSLNCSANQLTSLDVSNNTAMTSLNCSANQLTSLDVSNNTAMTGLYCYNNQLTSLDVSKNTALTYLYCYGNQIKGEAMDALISGLPQYEVNYYYSYQLYIYYIGNDGNVCTKAQVAAAKAKGWTPYYYDGEGWKIYYGSDEEGYNSDEGYVIINEKNFPDVNFRNWLLQKDYGQDGKLTEDEINGITSINVTYSYISSLKGIEYFTALTSLNCSFTYNRLTSLDVSKNTALTSLNCRNNQLTSLDVSGCTALTELWCYNNQLTSLDVSKNTALTRLDCDNNQLTSLDVSKNTALTRLDCYDNQLTSLDVSGCTALTGLYCYNNQLTSLDVSKNTALTELDCYNNQLTSLDVSKNTALTWLRCYGNQLTSLDVSNNTAMTMLSCSNNQLTSLDVSKKTALTELYCSNNQLTSLDVSGCTALTNLYCYSNQIKGKAMDAFISGLPQYGVNSYRLYIYYSGNDGNVCTKAQVAAACLKGWNPYYYNGERWNIYFGD